MSRTLSARVRNSESSRILLDTHVWVWDVFGTGPLSPQMRDVINDAAHTGRLRLSVISLWEISMLVTRRKIDLATPPASWFGEAKIRSRIVVEPLSPEIAIEAGDLPGGFRSDPADQIIVATARMTGATLITRDRRIVDYAAAGYVNIIAA